MVKIYLKGDDFLPKSKKDVERTIKDKEQKNSGEAIKERTDKEYKGSSGKLSGLGERDK